MKRFIRIALAVCFLAATGAALNAQAVVENLPPAACGHAPGETCQWHCTEKCDAGCCGDWQKWAWNGVPVKPE